MRILRDDENDGAKVVMESDSFLLLSLAACGTLQIVWNKVIVR